jgi:hypothetical protein
MSWSPLQREILEAMGLSPQRLASTLPADTHVPVQTSTTAPPSPNATSAVDRRNRPEANVALDAMTNALLRAAGVVGDVVGNTAARETVIALCPMPQALRGDSRAKRALWPRLRALRKH